MELLRFYKDIHARWYVDLPAWHGSKADLEMVAGADTMLDYMAEGENEIWLNLSEDYFKNSNEITLTGLATDIGNGAYYKLNKYRGIKLEQTLWLCNVALFVFGKFPEKIFFKIVEK